MINKYKNFYFEEFSFDLNSKTALFKYSFDKEVFFEEKIYFLDNNFKLRENLDINIINNILFSISIVIGISYYKIFPCQNLVVNTGFLDEKQIEFFKKFYINGLGEFLFRNNINPSGLFNFVNNSKKIYKKIEFKTSEKYIVPVGGGKDSIVSIELLKSFNKEFDLFTFSSNDNLLYENTTKNSGKNRLFIKRELSKNILEVIKNGGYNGHVPITGIIAFVLELISYLYDYKYIVLSNELSANFGNTNFFGVEVNHQWSKGYEFEKSFGDYIKDNISSEVKYFSLLRPMYELKIAQIFAKVGKKYFNNFSSCNTNFKIFKDLENKKNNYWCNSCPKCLFVFIILSAFLEKKEIINIFKENLFEKKELLNLFEELVGISGIKPFECVGTNKEVILALKMIYDKKEFNDTFMLDIFKKEVLSKMTRNDFILLENEILTLNLENNLIPKDLIELIKDYE
ncbi:hypothetical protein H3C61_02165 [Candidatus Gracilibacteria bacterium]|nr:hypothetical protein [Candidatus Gracilibacteria bacterium]